GVNDPFQVSGAELQRSLNRWQSDVNDGRVEDDHQLRRRDHNEREAEVARKGSDLAVRRGSGRNVSAHACETIRVGRFFKPGPPTFGGLHQGFRVTGAAWGLRLFARSRPGPRAPTGWA